MLNSTKIYLIAGLGVLTLSGVLYFTNKKPDYQTELRPSYNYSLKVHDQILNGYRSPAAREREEILSKKATSDNSNKSSSPAKKTLNADSPTVSTNTSDNVPFITESYSGERHSGYAPQQQNDSAHDENKKNELSSTSKATLGASPAITPTPFVAPTAPAKAPTSNEGSKILIPSIKGEVKPLQGLIASANGLFISAAYANVCTDPKILLLDLTDMSVLLDNPIKEKTIDENTKFDFDPMNLKLDLKNPNRYMLQTRGCEINYQRIISSFYIQQDLDQTTTLVSKIINTRSSANIHSSSPEAIQKLYTIIQERAQAGDSMERVYEIINQENSIKSSFQETFQGGSAEELTEAAPDLNKVMHHSALREKVPSTFDVESFHWNTQYITGYEWHVDGTVYATSKLWNYSPSANSRSAQIITLIVGHKNTGNDLVDRSKPYHEINFNVTVQDTYPTQSPPLDLASASSNPTLTRSIVLDVSTGSLTDGVYSLCETFSDLAITEGNDTPVDTDFTFSCTSGPTEAVNYTIQNPADGTVTLNLWARDAQGRISVFPASYYIEVDTTAPEIDFINYQIAYRADEVTQFDWTVTERNSSNTQVMQVEFFNGTTWTTLSDEPMTNGPHSGTLFSTSFLLPNINSSNSKLKITYSDTLGQQTVAESPVFEIQKPILSSMPLNLDMGTVENNEQSGDYTIEFRNSGAVTTKVCGPVTLTGAHAADFEIVSDACNSTTIGAVGCDVVVRATPSAKGSRNANAVLTCANDFYSTPITIVSLNNAPVVSNVFKGTLEDTSVTVNFGNINDTDGDVLTYSISGGPNKGTLSGCTTVASEYVCTYTPNANANGDDVFSFKANDGVVDSNTGVATITITPVNDAPTLTGPQSISTNEDVVLNFDLLGGTDIENDSLTYHIVSSPAQGTLSCVGGTSTSCNYSPATNFNGADSFTYRVSDGNLFSNTITVNVTVNALNDAPVTAANQSHTTNEDVALNFSINPGSDVDIPAQSLSYRLVTSPAHGTLSGCITTGAYSTNLNCTYTPNANYNGTDSFTYKVYDGVTDSIANATVSLTITAVNDAPTIASTQGVTTPEDTPITFNLNPGSDIESSPLTYIIVTSPSSGNLSCTGGTSRSCTFTPDADFEGSVTFTYKVNDGALDSPVAAVTVNVSGENDAPVVAADQTITTNEDTAVAFTINSATDIDVPAQTISYKIISNPTKGVLSGCINDSTYGTVRNCTYTPNANENGTDNFTYRANDGLTDSNNLATITINITPVNDAPTLVATQSISTNEDTALTFNLNAGADIENNTLTYSKVTDPSNGTLTCTGGTSRSCTYTPSLNFNGTDTFTYRVNDGSLNSTSATVTITVNPVNDAPVIGANQTVTTNEDILASFTLNAGSDVDIPAQTLSYILLSAPTKGTLSNCITTGSYSTDITCDYQPGANATGTDSFTYRVYDSLLQSSGTATVTINITAVNDAPTLAASQSVTTTEDNALTFSLTAGADTENDTLTYVKLTNTTNGTITCTGGTSRSCTYTPNANWNGTDSFTYRVNDGALNSTTATVTITVTPVNDPPVMAANQTYSIDDATNLAITLSPATDIDGGALTYKIVALPSNGTLSACITTGSYGTDLTCNYISNSNFNGTASFTFIAYDTYTDATTVATVTINVTDDTPAPAPIITKTSPDYTKVTGTTFTATSCTDTPMLFVNESTAPAAGAVGWQTCTTAANAITYTMGAVQGPHTIKVWSKDSYGNVSTTSTNFVIYYDTVVPAMTLTLPPALRGGQTYSLAWTATESYTATSLNFTVEAYNGSTWSTVGTTASTAGPLSNTAFSRSWTVPSVNTSSAQFRVAFTDRAGNSNTVTSGAFTIDSTAPALTVTSPAANSYHRSSATIAGACETGRDITFSGDIQATFTIACTAGTYSQLVNFSDNDGNKIITVAQTDAVGNTTSVSRTLIRDEVAPVMAKTSGNSPDFTRFNTPNTWGGTCEGNYTISVSGSQTTTFNCTAGSWSWTAGAKTSDGTYTYNLVQTDAAGNVSAPPLSLSWTRDATPPLFNMANPVAGTTGQTKNITNNLGQLTFNGACEGTNPISITGAATETISCSASSWSWTTPSVSADGLRTYTFSQNDAAGNTASIIVNWTRDTTGPQLTIASATVKSNTNTASFTGNCESGVTIEITGSDTTTISCTAGSYTYNTSNQTTDATRTYTIKQTFTVSPFNSTTVTGQWIRETDAPTVSSFSTTASNPTRSSFIPVSLTATSQNPSVNLSHFCVKSDVAIQPAANDSCFVAVNSPQVGKVPAQSLNLSGFSQLVGWTPKNYDVFVWVKDEAGNISNLTNAGAGTLTTDKINISYDPGIPPSVWNVMAANIPNAPLPPTRAQAEVPAGTDVYIRWRASDNIALPSGAITLYYTPNEINFTEIISGLNNANYGCTGVTLAADEGCYKWVGGSPLPTSYKIRVKVTDAGDVSNQSISNPLNSGLIKILAGNTESGLGGSAQTAMFFTRRIHFDHNTMVVTDDGQFYFADWKRGILTIDQADGKQKVFIPATGVSSGDGGPAVNAQIKYPVKIALDYQNRLLILDRDRIRRVDLNQSTPTIETIIGGGSNTADTVVNPRDVSIYAHGTSGNWDHTGMAFFALPNGDIYFQSEYSVKNNSTPTYRIRIYKAGTGQVISKYITGTGDQYVPTQDLSLCRLTNPGIAFDPSTSLLTGLTVTTQHNTTYPGCDQTLDKYSRAYFDPDTFTAIAPKDASLVSYWYQHYTGMDGKVYVNGGRNYVNRVNFDGTQTRIIGHGTNGECADGTLATACMMDVQNFYVTTAGKIYFTDRGMIRTVDADGKVKTLFGQKLTYGHGINALNARFSNTSNVYYLANGKIITNDTGGNYYKEFTPEGDIFIIAGNGAEAATSTTLDATATSLVDTGWGVVNKATGDIITSQSSNGYGTFIKLDRTTNRWTQIIGKSTGVNYTTADGELGLDVGGTTANGLHRGLPMGWDNNQLIMARMRHNSADDRYEDFMIKAYDALDGWRQSHIAGIIGYPANNRITCDATSPVTAATCQMPYWDTFRRFQWDAENNRWITAMTQGTWERRIFEFNMTTNNIKQIGITSSNIDENFTYGKIGTTEYLFYCNSGKIRKYNITTQTDMGTLPWSMTNLSCRGQSMDWNPTNQSIIFPFEQNGLAGVAEYFVP